MSAATTDIDFVPVDVLLSWFSGQNGTQSTAGKASGDDQQSQNSDTEIRTGTRAKNDTVSGSLHGVEFSPINRTETDHKDDWQRFPEVYARMLDHDWNLTLLCEKYFNIAMKLEVVSTGSELNHSSTRAADNSIVVNELYTRRIFLRAPITTSNSSPSIESHRSLRCTFGLLQVDLAKFAPAVQRDILAAQIPFGRILENHHIDRKIELHGLWHIHAPPSFFGTSTVVPAKNARTACCPGRVCTAGRTIRMRCNGLFAVKVLEILNPDAFTSMDSAHHQNFDSRVRALAA